MERLYVDSLARVGDTFESLSLAGIENAFFVDTRHGYPMTSFLKFRFRGPLDRSRLIRSVRAASMRHPLTHSIVQGEVPYAEWLPVEDFPKVCFEADLDPSCELDLRNGSGVLLTVRSSEEEFAPLHTIVIHWHHAVSDGIGIAKFMGDVLTYYGGLEEQLLTLNPELLRERERFEKKWSGAQQRERFWSDIRYSTKLLRAPASVLRPRSSEPSRYEYAEQLCSQVEFQTLRGKAAKRGIQLVDYSSGELLSTLHSWNTLFGGAHESSGIRLVLPIGLRHGSKDRNMPAANRLGYTFLQGRRGSELESPEFLRECNQKLRLRLADGVPKKLSRLTWFSRRMSRLLNYQKVFSIRSRHATAVFTLNPDLTQQWKLPRVRGCVVVDGLELLGISGAAPLRPNTNAAFAICPYAGEATVSVLGKLASGDSEALLNLFVGRLLEEEASK